MVSLHAENHGVRASARASGVYRGAGRSELPGGGGDRGVVDLHQEQDGLGPAERAVRPAGSC